MTFHLHAYKRLSWCMKVRDAENGRWRDKMITVESLSDVYYSIFYSKGGNSKEKKMKESPLLAAPTKELEKRPKSRYISGGEVTWHPDITKHFRFSHQSFSRWKTTSIGFPWVFLLTHGTDERSRRHISYSLRSKKGVNLALMSVSLGPRHTASLTPPPGS